MNEMNAMTLHSIIERYRPLNAMSSLPVVHLNRSGETEALWFNFYLDQKGDEFVVFIQSVLTLSNSMAVEEMKTAIRLESKITEYDEPPLSEEEYFSSLGSQFTSFNLEEMTKLLKQAEMQPLWFAYKTAIKAWEEK